MNSFVFVSCQVGTEKVLKSDLGKHHPELTFAFSRPGFVTFKVAGSDGCFRLNEPLKSPFARTWGHSLGSVRDTSDRLARVVELLPTHPYRHLHVWERDKNVPGERKFEPFHSAESLELGKQVKSGVTSSRLSKTTINRTARNGDFIADLVVVEPDLWFVGWHQASSLPSRWPGGVPPLHANEAMISRAYLKMQEALRWSQLPIAPGDLCVELGSAPGGACQALLERDLRVMGIDPALMDERVLRHPNFTHVRARAADLKRKEFADVRWLMADANVAPGNTLEAIEHIVTNRRVNIHGMLITLKFLDMEMAGQIDGYIDRIRAWGYRHVRARQLAFNRREICVVAAKSKGRLRFGRKRKPTN